MTLLAQAGAATAAEVKLSSSNGMKAVIEALLPELERTTGHKLAITWDSAAVLKRQIEGGAPFDLAILTPALVDDLAKQGKIAPGTVAGVARSGIGIAIRAGAPKHDIGTPEAFKRTLLAAKSITYSKEGQSGIYLERVIERLGIAAEMTPKTIVQTVGGRATAAVAAGEAELGFQLMSEILPVRGAELLGPLPAELQNYVVLTGGIGAAAKEPEAAKAVLQFLRTPAAAEVMKAKGMEAAAK